MGTVTAIILTKNEERQMPGVLENCRAWADQILIVDSGSTDRTVAIARERGADVIYREWDGDFSAQRNFALTEARGEWVLYMDADERLTPAAVTKVRAIKAGIPDHQYSFKRTNIAFHHHFARGPLALTGSPVFSPTIR